MGLIGHMEWCWWSDWNIVINKEETLVNRHLPTADTQSKHAQRTKHNCCGMSNNTECKTGMSPNTRSKPTQPPLEAFRKPTNTKHQPNDITSHHNVTMATSDGDHRRKSQHNIW